MRRPARRRGPLPASGELAPSPKDGGRTGIKDGGRTGIGATPPTDAP